jgi:hypothetical protein
MDIKLDKKNKRALKLMIYGLGTILVLMLFLDWIQKWRDLRQNIARTQQQLDYLANAEAKMAALSVKVPVVAVPQKEQKQLFAFREALNRQLYDAGITVKPFKVTTVAKSARPEYQSLYLQCSGSSNFENVLNFLADLKKNPYLVGIDELVISKPATTTAPTGGTRNTQNTNPNMPGGMPGFPGGFGGFGGGMPDFSGMAAAYAAAMQPPSGASQPQVQQRQSNVVNIELKVSTFVKR